jgi:hypothetical protein
MADELTVEYDLDCSFRGDTWHLTAQESLGDSDCRHIEDNSDLACDPESFGVEHAVSVIHQDSLIVNKIHERLDDRYFSEG